MYLRMYADKYANMHVTTMKKAMVVKESKEATWEGLEVGKRREQ